jgi:ethanolaminephosphotransferase
MTSIPFFLNTLEEYYTGELNLPIIHGVSEGTVIACFCMNLTGFFGMEIWKYELTTFGITSQLNHFLATLCFFAGLGFGLNSLFNILRDFKEKNNEVIRNIQMFCYLVASLLLVIFYSDSEVLKNYPKLIVILYGFAFAKLVGHLHLSHLADAKFNQYRVSFMVSFFFLSVLSVKNIFNQAITINIDNFIFFFLGVHIICWMHFAYNVTEEMCQLLGIYRFTVGKRIK